MSETETLDGIRAACRDLRFHSMLLEHNGPNSFLLTSTVPVSNIRLANSGQQEFPYFPDFQIKVHQMNASNVEVSIKTLRARVIVGKKPGIHGGWAHRFKEIQPVGKVEEEVLEDMLARLTASEGKKTEVKTGNR